MSESERTTPAPKSASTIPQILCPSWCERTQLEHAVELLRGDWDGRVIHQSRTVGDGWMLSSVTWPDGTPDPDDDLDDVVVMCPDSSTVPVVELAEIAWSLLALTMEAGA
ncbi:hypothetical protein [Nocardioides sp. GY 10127]|uniref:hypothetical protein n=1 Tax=Nocardioides sp. GY 10127 TaxID=2569762 RepID=UPI0010A9106C|nr:hypothetical protein [Nocardioides sp. GY 10127]TIC84117.1 hypothetical protein E8D37_04730 [Nocardioides sp. GY 10127]